MCSSLACPDDEADELVDRRVVPDDAGCLGTREQDGDARLHLVELVGTACLEVDPGRTQGVEKIVLGRGLARELLHEREQRLPGEPGGRLRPASSSRPPRRVMTMASKRSSLAGKWR